MRSPGLHLSSVWFGVVAVAAVCPGCTAADGSHLDVTLQLETVGGVVQPCPVGFDTILVTATPLDNAGVAAGTPIADRFA
jgi:hypothetical protein